MFLAMACDASAEHIDQVLAEERSAGQSLVPYMKEHFALHGRHFLAEDRQRDLSSLLSLIERKPSS